MAFLSKLSVAGSVLLAASASAHGIATALVDWPSGVFYPGYNPNYKYINPPPVVIGWSIPDDIENTFISPSSYNSSDIICHLNAAPAGLEAPVNAGDIIELKWNMWATSHKGPVIDYLANCNGPCSQADKTKLKFFKIDEVGLVDKATDTWADDQLLANNLTWSVRLPTDIAPGNYVLRHEMLALHAASSVNGAQNYPFCFNLAISSSGDKNPEGVLGTELYKSDDPGVLFDLFGSYTTYVIPGPTLYSGALTATQTKHSAPLTTSSGVVSYVPATATAAAAARGVHTTLETVVAKETESA